MNRRIFHTFAAILLIITQIITAMPVVHGAAPHATRSAMNAGTVTDCSNDTDFSAKLSGGGVIDFSCGEATITVSNTKAINVNTTIDGGGKITLSGNNLRRIFNVAGGVTLTLRNITIANGFANTSDGGAIVGLQGSTLIIENSTFRENRSSGYSGGALLILGTATIRNSHFEKNSAENGGAIYVRWGNSSLTIENSTFVENEAVNVTDGWGGAILTWDGAEAIVRDSTFTGNKARRGGAIYNHVGFVGSTLTVERSRFANNQASRDGGAIFNQAALLMKEVDIEANKAEFAGGGIYNDAGNIHGDLVRIVNNEIIDLSTDTYGGGGGIYNTFEDQVGSAIGVVNLTRSTIAGNIAQRGGGIFSDSFTELTLTAVTIAGHTAQKGGGLYSSGDVQISNSTFSGNHSGEFGGAIFKNDGTLNISFTTFAANGTGNNATIYINTEAEAGNTLVANIVDGRCAGEPLGSAGYNLESGVSCGFIQPTDKRNVNPELGPLSDNGGATLTHMPAANSPAINAAGENCPISDQRGFARPTDGLCDMGSVETAAPPLSVTPFPTPPVVLPPRVTPEPPETPVSPRPLVHAQVPNGVAPTISVSPAQGRAGDTITVSGKSPAGSSQVRVVSMLDGETMGSVVVDAAQNGDYILRFTVPNSTRPGPIEICATVPALSNAQFACAPFTITDPPPASISGSLPSGVLATDAVFELRNGVGEIIASAPIDSAGKFAIKQVPPGVYSYNVSGAVSQPLASGAVLIQPAQQATPIMKSLFDPNSTLHCFVVKDMPSAIGTVTAYPSRNSINTQQTIPSANAVLGRSGSAVTLKDPSPLGIYISGVTNIVEFTASPQASGQIQAVIFEFKSPTKDVERMRDNAPPWSVKFDVGRLAPSTSSKHSSVWIYPVVNGKEECPYKVDIEVIKNPFEGRSQPPNAIVWDDSQKIYRIKGIIPNVPNVLPSKFNLPPDYVPELPFLKRFQNELDAGIIVEGTLNLDGIAHITAIKAKAKVKVLSRNLVSKDSTLLKPNLKLPITNIRETPLRFDPYPVVPYVNVPIAFAEVPVISFFGLVDVTVNASAGVGAGVTLTGVVKPLKPELEATLTATGNANAELGVGIRLLAGLARAGATARLDATLDVPLSLYLTPSPYADINACLAFRFSVRAYVSALWGAVSEDATKEVARWSDCLFQAEAALVNATFEDEPTVPEVLASPVVAIGTNGMQISAYIENTAPEGKTSQFQVLARMRADDNAAWSEPVALSDAAYSADAPAVAFVGPEQWPMVVWVEKKLPLAEATKLGHDINAILQRQEIVYRLYRNGTWEPAVYLTDDLLGDGLPALAGAVGGGVLAWTRDLDGNWLTRDDQRIAITTFDPGTATFAPFVLLSGGGTGLNNDVRVAIDPALNRPYAVWVYDADAQIETADDRRLALAYFHEQEWVLLNPQPLPSRVDSPTITITPNGVQLAFLVREPDQKNNVAVLGTNGVLWTAHQENGVWKAEPVLDDNDQPAFAEDPILANNGEESLLLFRRFGQELDNSQFGQVAMSRIFAAESPSSPLYLTDEPRQNWQANLAINPLTGRAAIVNVSRTALVGATAAELAEQTAIAETQAIAAVEKVTLSHADDPVSMLGFAATADPALDPLQVSTPSPRLAETFTISVTVRNVGREDATGVTVRLYSGTPGKGTLLQTSQTLPTLGFNETTTIGFAVTSNGGRQSFYAEVVSAGTETSSDNNTATIELGTLSAPVMLDVYESQTWSDGLEVQWIEPKDELILGYRIWRSNSANGTFDLIGETTLPGFTDVPLPRETNFCYAVEAYNANTISPRSNAICGKLAAVVEEEEEVDQIFMPLLGK